jgi:hypothetical protein
VGVAAANATAAKRLAVMDNSLMAYSVLGRALVQLSAFEHERQMKSAAFCFSNVELDRTLRRIFEPLPPPLEGADASPKS